MKVVVDGWAWLPKAELTETQQAVLRDRLTVIPVRTSTEQQEDPEPLPLYVETATHMKVAREFFFQHRKAHHEVVDRTTEGDKSQWSPLSFAGQLRAEQEQAAQTIVSGFHAGSTGAIVQAKPGWGKTITALAITSRLQVPTLVVVHKEFLMDQWAERIAAFLPSASVGRVQQDVCDFEGRHIVLGMVHSLGGKDYGSEFWDWPGLVIVDEVHRIGARTWNPVPARFSARYRLGFSATPRRKDKAENAFLYHIGPVRFVGKELRLGVDVKRVRTKFQLVQTPRFNPNLSNRNLLLKFLCASRHRNSQIADQIIRAVEAGRKCLVLSERIGHLNMLESSLLDLWPASSGKPPTIGYYVGGRKRHEYEEASEAQVIFATSQYASEGLDIPTLDTLFLVSPMSDVEQAVGRIQRPSPGKKNPIVVDFRDDAIPMFRAQGNKRDIFYEGL
jgi:Type III restriction enzyme, res subunit